MDNNSVSSVKTRITLELNSNGQFSQILRYISLLVNWVIKLNLYHSNRLWNIDRTDEIEWTVRIRIYEIQRSTTTFIHLKVKFETATWHQNVPMWIELTTEHSIYRWRNSSSVGDSTSRRIIIQLGQNLKCRIDVLKSTEVQFQPLSAVKIYLNSSFLYLGLYYHT